MKTNNIDKVELLCNSSTKHSSLEENIEVINCDCNFLSALSHQIFLLRELK